MTILFRQLRVAVLTCCLAGVLLCPTVPQADEANIFIYHRFGESRYPSTNIDVKLFADHLQYLKDSGKLVMPLPEVVKHLKAGRRLPPNTVVLTVDDAFDSFLAEAMPLLEKYRFPVTLFVNTDGVGTSGYLDWDELRQLVRDGVTIGNHTATHDYLIERKRGESQQAWNDRVRGDILRAQDAFEKELGFRPDLFAYTYGEYSPELVEIVRGLGFSAAVAQQSGVVSSASDIFLLPRFPMGGSFASLQSFRNKANMHALEAEVLTPESPVIVTNDPPVLKLKIDAGRYDLRQLQGFVQGDNRLQIDVDQGGAGIVEVRAEKSLAGRRNKYTLTAPLKDGSGWAWFSQPWFKLNSGF